MSKKQNKVRFVIPEAVVIKGQLFTVHVYTSFMEYYKKTSSADSYGMCNKEKREIYLNVEAHKTAIDPEEELYLTYLHEIAHAVVTEVSLDLVLDSGMEEIIVDNLSRELFHVIMNQRNIDIPKPKKRGRK